MDRVLIFKKLEQTIHAELLKKYPWNDAWIMPQNLGEQMMNVGYAGSLEDCYINRISKLSDEQLAELTRLSKDKLLAKIDRL